MFILQATDIKKQYGARTVLDFESIQVYEGDKIGVVGDNGAGKSTLMSILLGELEPDSGSVTRRLETAFIRQLAPREGTLSGGESAKLHIRRETEKENAIIFADEPTANLDEDGVRWVRSKLLAARAVLLISHDRELLDAVCNRIIEIRDGKLRFYTGDYSDYERLRAEEDRQAQEKYDDYRHEKTRLKAAARVHEDHVARQRQKKRREYAKNSSEARLGGYKRAASMQKQERIKKVLDGRVERLEQVDRVKTPPKISIDFSQTSPPGGRLVIEVQNLSFAYGGNTVLDDISFAVKNGAKIAITGKNGAGKTTLLRLIRDGHSAIRTAPKLKLGFLYQAFENLDADKTVLDNALDGSVQDKNTVRGVLAGLLFRGDDVFKRVGALSGGERMRLALAKLIVGDSNALLLDEPTNYLDIRSMEAVEIVLREYPGTLLVVSHDRRFLSAVTDEELHLDRN